jgi:hypothetical protein
MELAVKIFLDMTDVSNGIYIIEVISGIDKLSTTKLVRL